MNGRIYDPLLGRFLSADRFVQNPGDLQSYNRYSYVHNNPLSKTDPTGEIAVWGAVLGFGGDLAIQVGFNLAAGKDLKTSIQDVSIGQALVSGAQGAVGLGTLKLLKNAGGMVKTYRSAKRTSTVVKSGKDGMIALEHAGSAAVERLKTVAIQEAKEAGAVIAGVAVVKKVISTVEKSVTTENPTPGTDENVQTESSELLDEAVGEEEVPQEQVPEPLRNEQLEPILETETGGDPFLEYQYRLDEEGRIIRH